MAKSEIQMLQHVIQEVHGAESLHLETTHVFERLGDTVIWEGDVHIFSLSGIYEGMKCYGWVCIEKRPRKQCRYVTVMEAPNVTSAEHAVRASLASDARTWPN